MKKIKFIFLLFFVLAIFFGNNEKTFAAIGDRTTPYTAWKNNRFTFQEYEWDNPKVVELQLLEMYRGEEANNIVQQENMFNEVPATDEEWILMGFNLKYVSGPEEPLYASDVIWSEDSFYTNSGQKIIPISTPTLSENLSGYGEYDIELYPGGQSKVYYGILVKKTVGYPVFKVAAGYNNTTYQTNYKWFTTNPSYIEPVSSPTNVKVAANTYNSNKLSWTAASGVSGYEIYRSTSSTGTYTKIATTTSTTYTNTSLTSGTTYFYKVRAYKSGTPTTYSSYSPVVSAKPILTTPNSLKAISSSYNSIKTSWAAVSDASGYEVYQSTSSSGTYTKIGTTTSTSLTSSNLTTNKPYYFKVRAYKTVGTSKVYSNYSTIVTTKPILTTPNSAKAVSSSYNSIKTSWAAVSGASGYEVYRSTSSTGTYSKVGATTSTSFTNSNLTTNKPYYFKVRAYKTVGTSKVYSNYSTVVTTKPIPSVPTNFKASRLSSTSIKLTWSQVTGASGYQLYRSTSATGTYSLVKDTTSLSYTNTGLIKGKKYYYKLRSYKTVGTTKVYSGFTTVINMTP